MELLSKVSITGDAQAEAGMLEVGDQASEKAGMDFQAIPDLRFGDPLEKMVRIRFHILRPGFFSPQMNSKYYVMGRSVCSFIHNLYKQHKQLNFDTQEQNVFLPLGSSVIFLR